MDPLQRLEAKLDRIVEMVSGIKEDLAGQAAHSADHVRRIQSLESRTDKQGDTISRLKGALTGVAFLTGAIESIRHFLGK